MPGPEIRSADPAAIRRGADLLRAGELVVFPTETVYGVAARAGDPAAVERLRAAKRRPADQPFVVMVAALAQAERLARVSARARALMNRFWPGPLTLVLPVAGAAGTVGVRIPDHPAALALLREVAEPLLTSSANRAGEPAPADAAAAWAALHPDVALVLDGGPCRLGKASTILDLTTDAPRVLREGMIPRSELIP